ncbi:MAG: IS21 family transposase [Myxococcaceae bacterium]
MGNVLSNEKREQVIALGRLGWPLRRIESETGVRRETASAYLKAAKVAVRPPGRWGRSKPANEVTADPDRGTSANPANEVTADLLELKQAYVLKTPAKSLCAPHEAFVREALQRGRNAMAIYQQLVDDHGFTATYESVKRYVRTLRRDEAPKQAHPVIVTAPGEESQVDWGEGPLVLNPETGKYRRTRLFTMVLGYSRKAVHLLAWKSSTEVWAKLHEEAFRRLGGAPQTTVLDNLREGVLTPDVYEPRLNPLFRDVLKHYGVVGLPCRVRHPDRKGKVESGIGHAQRTPLKGMRFDSLEEAQAFLDRWTTRWADTRIHGTTKRQVAVMFAEEAPLLQRLPVEPFRYYRFGERTVHLDGCIEVEGGYYGVPPGHLGQRLRVQWDELYVRVLAPVTGELLREHRRTSRGGRRMAPADRPASTPPTTLELLARASRAGRAIGALCAEMHRREGEASVRRVQGVMGLAKKYGPALVEEACALGLEVRSPNYRFVRRYLERHPVLALKQVDELIRPLTHYQQLIERLTADTNNERTHP